MNDYEQGQGGTHPGQGDVFDQLVVAVLGDGPHRTVDLLDLLEQRVQGPVDVVRAADDLLPRLAHEQILDPALATARQLLRPGGLLVAAAPELGGLGRLRPMAPPPRVTGRGESRKVTVQLWEWEEDGESYNLEVVQLVRSGGGWDLAHSVSTWHRALTADEISGRLTAAGFAAVDRLPTDETGHPLPVWIAVAPG